jgi:sugar lactone lactonase YvrE
VATFNTPRGVAVDITGNVYVADTDNNTIRKITPAGVVSTLAGTAGVPPGSLDGSGAAAQFYSPTGVAVDTQGNVYVADSGNNTIRMITPSGGVTTLAGTAGQVGSLDGTGPAAQFNSPSGVAVDTQGNVYVTDSSNNTIRKIAPGGVVTTLAGTALVVGSLDGAGAAASFQFPNGIAVDTSGTVYVADTNNNTIRVITPAGVVSTLAGTAGVGRGSVDGTGADARFGGPLSLALDSLHGYVYVADTGNFTVRRISPAGVVTTVVGQAGQVNTIPSGPLPGQITTDNGIAVDPVSGNMYISLNDDAIITAPF